MKMRITMNVLVGVFIFFCLSISDFCAAGGSPPQEIVQGSPAQRHETKVSASDVFSSSEVEYVDGPLVPLFDFLIQRRLFKFCKLLRDAGLEEELISIGSYWTLFAPSDSSFFFLPGGTLENLKKNPQQLREFILYHFINGDLPSSQIVNELLVDSIQGAALRFNIYGQVITVSGAQIQEADLEYDLGRVHIVDRPLYPIPTGDTVAYLRTQHQKLYRLLLDAGLVEYLSSGTFTILAPDDDAFEFLSVEFKDAMSANRSLAERVLLNHILPGSLYIGGITDGLQWETVGGGVIVFTTKRGLVFANDIPIVLPDVPFTNGVIHVLNRVLLPEGVESDCQCKPSTGSPQRPSSPGSRQTTRPQFVQNIPTTRKPFQQTFTRQTSQTSRPNVRQTPGTFDHRRPTGSQTTTQSISNRPTQRPFNPSQRRPQPVTTRSPFGQPLGQPFPEDDLNTVIEPNLQTGQKRPDQTRTNYPTRQTQSPRQPPRVPTHSPRVQPPRQPVQPPRQPVQPPRSQSPNVPQQPNQQNPSEQDLSPVSQPPQTNRWDTRPQTQQPRYPTPPRGPYRPPTTRRPQTTRSYNQVTQPAVGKRPQHSTASDLDITTQIPSVVHQTQKPAVTSWNQRNQITRTTRQQIRTTSRPARIPPPRRQPQPTQPRPGSFPTPAPISTDQPFESSRECRRRGDRLTPSTQNLPVCPESPLEDCQNPPYNPSDSRLLCPSITDGGCRQPTEPFNPSDNRPICPSVVPGSGCRNFGDPTYIGDRRPLCSPSPPSPVGCRDPSSPFSPTDSRPLCSTSVSNDVSPSGDSSPQGCRRSSEASYPGDTRLQCPEEDEQQDCRPFLERPKPGDRRPLCRTNGQTPQQRPPQPRPPTQQRPAIQQRPQVSQQPSVQQRPPTQQRPPAQQRPSHVTKGQSQTPGRIPQHQQRPPFQPNNQNTISQTSRRPSWQPTTQVPQRPNQPIGTFDTQNVGNVPPASSSVRPPSQPQRPGSFQTRPQPGLLQPQTVTPQSGSPNSETSGPEPQPQFGIQPNPPQQAGFRPSNPPRAVSRPYPTRPQAVSRVTVAPQTSPPRIAPQTQGPYPTRPSIDFNQPPQHSQTSRPNVPGSTSNVSPSGRQPFIPQRRPINPPRQQITPVTSLPGRGTTTARVPVSVTSTSTTTGEDSRRSLYEIVEDPALLIQGQPVKLTKILALFNKAGIGDILTGPGPTTVFLPSDDAFAALPKVVIDQLEENPELLRQVLLYHITNVEILPSPQSESYTVPTLEGTQMVITMLRGGRLILISGAKAIAVTRANNGIFYVINQLLYPLPHPDLLGAIQSRPDLSILTWLLPFSGLSDLLQGQTPYTILAPTDNAFGQLSPAVYDELTQNTTALQEVLMNHIIEGAHYGREFFNGPTFQSARGGKLKFQVVSYGYQVNEINVKTPEIVTGSGVIHLIDQIIFEEPDLKYFNQIENSINEGGQTTTSDQQPNNELQPFFGQQPPTGQRTNQPPTDIQRIPQGQPQVTGLQPPSRANARVPNAQTPSVGQQQPNNGQTQFGGRRSSVQPQTVNRASQEGQRTSTLPSHSGQRTHSGPSQAGQRTPTGPSSFNQRQPAFQAQSSPGGTNVADLARSMGLNRFANWITNTGLLEKVHDGGVYTVFAPTDDAVNALPQDMVQSIDSNPEQTRSLLQYHILPQRINLNSLNNDENYSTLLQGKKIRFNVYPGPHLNCKQVVTASGTPVGEALVTMGSVQLIPVTQVLYQPTGNLLSIIEASPILQNLSHAIRSARISWVLSGNGPLTFFAPSDTAFESITEEERKALIEDKQAFSELLKRHLVRGTYFSSGVQEDMEKKSENNQDIKISLQEGVMTVNSIPVTYSDITATNGVLHVIDHFL